MVAKLSLFLALVALAATTWASDPFQTATMDQVERWIEARDAVVYDVNPDEVFEKNHLPGARFLTGKQWTSTLPPARGARLVFYCANPK
jgi:rhodanese-related sulfurtransferase